MMLIVEFSEDHKAAPALLEALQRNGIESAGLVIGSWPRQPGVAETDNRDALARLAPVRAVLPAGAAALGADAFGQMSDAAFEPGWIAGLI